jgi:hypothetical protein
MMPAERQAAPTGALEHDLDELVRLGYVRRLPGARYTLTAKGQEALKAADNDGR